MDNEDIKENHPFADEPEYRPTTRDYPSPLDQFYEKAKEFVKNAPKDLHRHLMDNEDALLRFSEVEDSMSDTLRLASELNEAVIAARASIEELGVEVDFNTVETAFKAADELTGHLLEVINIW